jgi:hypothetical protein
VVSQGPIQVPIDPQRIAQFCRKWMITEFALFGSVLRDDFRPDSDVDVLITLANDAPWSLYEWIDMKGELTQMFGRDVDLVEKSTIQNPFRRQTILSSNRVIYAAA